MVKLPLGKTRGSLAELEPGMDEILSLIAKAATAKKGENTVVLDVSSQIEYLDYLVLTTGSTEIHNRALADEIIEHLGRYDIIPDGLNGYSHGDWILIDYGVLVVHVFTPETREFYQLEELWAGGSEVEV